MTTPAIDEPLPLYYAYVAFPVAGRLTMPRRLESQCRCGQAVPERFGGVVQCPQCGAVWAVLTVNVN